MARAVESHPGLVLDSCGSLELDLIACAEPPCFLQQRCCVQINSTVVYDIMRRIERTGLEPVHSDRYIAPSKCE